MTTIIAKIIASNYVATEQQVEALAHYRYTQNTEVNGSDATYLRILLVGIQARLGPKRRGRISLETQGQVLEETHAKFYDAILRGVTTPEIAIDETLPQAERSARALERNRRSAFARSSKSTLAIVAAAGVDLRGLDASLVTKASLRALVSPPEPSDKVARQIVRSRGSLLRALARQAKTSPNAAHDAIQAAIDALTELQEGMGGTSAPADAMERRAPRDRGPARTRVGSVMLNRPGA